MQRLATLILVTLFTTGCVVFPTERTYFEPNSQDGKPASSSSCGYNRTSDDALERDVGELHVHVSPSYEEGSQLSVTILFRSPKNNATVFASRIGLRNNDTNETYLPTKIVDEVYSPHVNDNFYSQWFHLTYPVASDSLGSISIYFEPNSLILDGDQKQLEQFRFSKVTKSDIYYGSINC